MPFWLDMLIIVSEYSNKLVVVGCCCLSTAFSISCYLCMAVTCAWSYLIAPALVDDDLFMIVILIVHCMFSAVLVHRLCIAICSEWLPCSYLPVLIEPL